MTVCVPLWCVFVFVHLCVCVFSIGLTTVFPILLCGLGNCYKIFAVHVLQYLMLWSLIVVSEGKKVNWESILCLPYVQNSGVLLSYINLYIQ